MLYRVRKPGVGYLFSGSYGSRWSKTGKVWSLPRNVVFAVEQSSWHGVYPMPHADDELPPSSRDEVAWRRWRNRVEKRNKLNWRDSFASCTVESFEPGTPFVEVPLSEFLRQHGGRRWRELTS